MLSDRTKILVKNFHTYTLSAAEQRTFDPVALTAKLKEAGFVLLSDVCPVKIKQPWEQSKSANGDIIFTQWEIEVVPDGSGAP